MNWVQKRAECTIQKSFESIVDRIRKDIKTFNNLQTRFDGRFIVIHKEHSGFAKVVKAHIVLDDGKQVPMPIDKDSPHCITVEIKDSNIYAEVHTEKSTEFSLIVERKWNSETLTCDLIHDGKVKQPWNISESILEPFIFEQTE